MKDYTLETEGFIERLRQTEAYKEYVRQRQNIKHFPELKEQIDAFRQENFRLQMETDSDTLFDEIDRFEQEYAEFRKNPVVNDFLAAELACIRMIQEVNEQISGTFADEWE